MSPGWLAITFMVWNLTGADPRNPQSKDDVGEPVVTHVQVFAEPGKFGGWPANHGIWSWGNEILVGFSKGTYKDLGPYHHIDRDKPEEYLLARSRDGGETWTVETPQPPGMLLGTAGMRHGTLPPGAQNEILLDLKEPIDFEHPDLAFTLRMEEVHKGTSRFFHSYDRGHHWKGPYRLPTFGLPGVMARTDYVVNGPRDCLAFVSASKANEREGRPICIRTRDGGLTWELQGFIGPEPAGYAIMPSTVRLGPGSLLTTVRVRDPDRSALDAYQSTNDGRNWRLVSTPEPDAGEGNPPSLARLKDGRLALVYGLRREPYGIWARLSQDEGRHWTDPIPLRTDAGGRDMGYVRTIVRPDGVVVAVYYFHDQSGPDRYIAATLWTPDSREPGDGSDGP